jgi:hypothetical protein
MGKVATDPAGAKRLTMFGWVVTAALLILSFAGLGLFFLVANNSSPYNYR